MSTEPPSPSLPFEIIRLVVKYAICRARSPHFFNTPPYDLQSIDGFARASPLFAAIVRSLSSEKVVLEDWLGIMHLKTPGPHVKDLQILDLHTVGEFKGDLDDQFFNALSQFTQLTSLSLPTMNYSRTLLKLQSCPFATILRRLDFRFPVSMLPLDGIIMRFPSLLELRLGAGMGPRSMKSSLFDERDRNLGGLANGLAIFLSGSPNLRSVSIHMTLDNGAAFVNQMIIHRTSVEHLMPSEGYERHYADCPFCTASYHHDAVVYNELLVTYFLAQRMPHLTKVFWANAWLRTRHEESGQRGISITREENGGKILLLRDDGWILPIMS